MTLVNTETGELLDAGAAERRAMKISLRLDSIAENFDRVMPMIREAIQLRDDIALGYRSTSDYVSDRFGAALSRLPIELRQATQRELKDAGLSTRAIASVVGVSHKTVVKDSQVVPPVPPAAAMPDEAPPVPKPRPTVTGIDGKTYSASKPPVPKPKAERNGVTTWSRAVQRITAQCPINDLTDEQVAELRGAITYLCDYTAGFIITQRKEIADDHRH